MRHMLQQTISMITNLLGMMNGIGAITQNMWLSSQLSSSSILAENILLWTCFVCLYLCNLPKKNVSSFFFSWEIRNFVAIITI